MRPAVLALVAMLGVLTGCSEDYSVGLQLQSDPPLDPELTRDRAIVDEGLAVGVRAVAFEDDELVDDDDVVIELASSDTGVVDVRPGLDPNTFVIIGRRQGAATIDAFVDGERARPLEVVVEAQPLP